MKLEWGAVAGCLAMAAVVGIKAQTANNAAAPNSALNTAALQAPGGKVLREIDDPATGHRWLVLRDPNHPAGPGRLVLAQQSIGRRENDRGQRSFVRGGERRAIHAGDAVTVEEHTSVVDMQLQAVALEPSAEGGYFKARLEIGGKVVRVMAVAPGRALFGPESEMKP